MLTVLDRNTMEIASIGLSTERLIGSGGFGSPLWLTPYEMTLAGIELASDRSFRVCSPTLAADFVPGAGAFS